MVEPKYPFRDSLRRAQDIYLEAVSDFIEIRLGGSSNDVLDFSDISNLFRRHWYDSIDGHFRSVDEYYEARSIVQLIVEGRNRSSHPPWDLNPDYVRTHLFIIAEFLGKINRNLDQQEVNTIIDELFHDDTPERLEETEKQLKNIESEKIKLEKSNEELSDKLDNIKIQLSELESMKNKLESDITSMSQDMIEKSLKIKTTTTQLLKSKERQKKSTDEKITSKELITTLEGQIECLVTEHKLEIKSLKNELSTKNTVLHENKVVIESFKDLLSVITIDKPHKETIFSPTNINSSVRFIDQRKTDRKNYIINLHRMDQPSIYYVEDEDRMYQFLTENLPDISDAIEKHNQETSKEEEEELLVRLGEGDLKTVVSNSTFSKLPNNNIHIIFCHLSPGFDVFVNRCQPAFLSEKYCYLHLIYDYETDMETIISRFPDREKFNTFYVNLKGIDGIQTNFVSTDIVLKDLDINKPAFDPICDIFQEIGMIEKNNNNGIKLLSSPKKRLDESSDFIKGLEKRKKYQEFYDFQHSHSCEELWNKIEEKAEIGSILKDYDNQSVKAKSETNEEIDTIKFDNTNPTLE